MNNVFLDIRGRALKVLITEGEVVKYTKVFESFSLYDAECAKTFRQISDESKVRPDAAHLILPSEEVTVKVFTLQKMDVADAEKIISRRIKETGKNEPPVFHLTPWGSAEKDQAYIVTIFNPESIKKHVKALSGHGLKVKTVSTSLLTLLKAYEKREDVSQTCALVDIESDSLEITVVSPSQALRHERIPLEPIDIEKEVKAGLDGERIRKRKLYGMIDALYSFILKYREEYADTPIDKVLLCGAGALEGLDGTVSEGINIKASVWNTFRGTVSDGPLFTALHGLSFGLSDGTDLDLMARDSSGRGPLRISKVAAIAAVCLSLAVFASICLITEVNYKRLKERRDALVREDQMLSTGAESTHYLKQVAQLKGLSESGIMFYALFRHLSNNLPEEVSLEGISFRREGDVQLIDLKFVSMYDIGVGSKRSFTQVMNSINALKYLRVRGGPTFSVSGEGKDKVVHFLVSCGVSPYEKAE